MVAWCLSLRMSEGGIRANETGRGAKSLLMQERYWSEEKVFKA